MIGYCNTFLAGTFLSLLVTLSDKHGSLNSSTISNSLIWVDRFVETFPLKKSESRDWTIGILVDSPTRTI